MPIKAVVFDAYGTLYDIQSVASVTEAEFPGYGSIITQIWRIKQLEYTWLRSAMRRYADFAAVTRDSLLYTLRVLALPADDKNIDRIVAKYLDLDLYPDAIAAIETLHGCKRAILSNGSPAMLGTLTARTGLDQILDAVISVDARRTYKPDPSVYDLSEATLGAAPADTLFVSSNPWDVAGAKAFGFRVAWIERVSPEIMAASLAPDQPLTPLAMFQALRTQMDALGFLPDYRIRSLGELAAIVRSS